MDIAEKEKLISVGINVDDGLNRFLGNEEMYIMFLKKMRGDEYLGKLHNAVKAGDIEEAFESAHTLKGVIANLSIDSVSEIIVPFVEELRAGSLEHGEEYLEKLEKTYNHVMDTIGE